MVRVSAALIVRDEEDQIGPCLDCLAQVADEIIVVDTGSSDRTEEIARQKGGLVSRLPWQDDFSYARNAAIDQASGDWILYVDADERVTVDGDLAAALCDPAAIAATVQFQATSHQTPYCEYRLFRNRPDIRFRGVIHETVLPDIEALVVRSAGTIVEAPLSFLHLGYEGDLTHKHRRNLPLLRQAVVDDPERAYLWQALGEAELGLGDLNAAERTWRHGLQIIRGRPPASVNSLLYAHLIDLHLSWDGADLPDVGDLVAEGLEAHPTDPMLLWHAARHAEAEADFGSARCYLERLLRVEPKDHKKARAGYDRRLFGFFAWGLLGVCDLREGDFSNAVKWLRLAEEAEPTDMEIRIKRTLAEKRLTETS